MLTEGQCVVMERIARHCMRTHPSRDGWIGYEKRYEAALDGIVEYLHENGWPDQDKPLFDAGSRAITRAAREPFRHLNRGAYWVEPPGAADALGEAITDRIGIWQLVWGLPDDLWSVVWAMGEAIRRGEGKSTAAALAGMGDTAFTERLTYARRWCLIHWCAPGEHVSPYYASRGNKPRKIHAALDKRREREQRREAA